jgi:predicted nucleic acid-binding Zn ribbon protein
MLGTASPRTLSWVFEHWAETVGEEIAGIIRPEKIQGDALVASAGSSAWASHARTIAQEVLDRVRAIVGSEAPSRLVVRVRNATSSP